MHVSEYISMFSTNYNSPVRSVCITLGQGSSGPDMRYTAPYLKHTANVRDSSVRIKIINQIVTTYTRTL